MADIKEQMIEEQNAETMIADLDTIDKKMHPKKQEDLVDRAEVLAKVEPALARVRRHDVTMSVREVLALVNGIIADIKSL